MGNADMGNNFFKNRGFTLIELMVVIAILGLLGAIAIPAYTNYVMRVNRKEAMTDLMAANIVMESCLKPGVNFLPAECQVYDDPGQLTETGLYRITANLIDTDEDGIIESYELTAVPETSFQQEDTNCYHFILDALGNKTSKDNADTPNPTTGCW